MAAAAEELRQTFLLIQEFWPEFPMNIQDLRSPSSDFVVSFFRKFVAEVNDRIRYIVFEDTPTEVADPAQDYYSMEIPKLYDQVKKIFKEMEFNSSFCLHDMYFPKCKRTHAALKLSIHLLIYVNNSLDDLTGSSSEIHHRIEKRTDLENLKQQNLQDIAENAEYLGRLEDAAAELRRKLDISKAAHEKMSQDKAAGEKIKVAKNRKVKDLQSENEYLDYELSGLEAEEKRLQESLVTEEEFESLKHLEKQLELQRQQLVEEDQTIYCAIDKLDELMKHIDENAKELDNLHFDDLRLGDLCKLTKEVESLHNINNQLKAELSSLNDEKAVQSDQVIKKSQTKAEGQKFLVDVKARTALEFEIIKKEYEQQIVLHAAKTEEAERLKTEMVLAQEDIKKAEYSEKVLKQAAVEEYKKILDTTSRTTNKFNDVLLDLTSYFC